MRFTWWTYRAALNRLIVEANEERFPDPVSDMVRGRFTARYLKLIRSAKLISARARSRGLKIV